MAIAYPSPQIAETDNGLAPFPEQGRPSGSRIKDVASLLKIYETFKTADEQSAMNRQIVQAMVDGEPPYSADTLRASGNAFRFNVNFLEAEAAFSSAKTRYTDLIDSVDMLAKPILPYNIGDASERNEISDIIGEEFHYMVRGWSEFDSLWEQLAGHFIGFGVGFLYFPDDDSWKFRVGGLDEFCFARRTRATEEAVEVLIGDVPYLPHELYKYISDEDAAAKMGWNVEQVKKELVKATKNPNASRRNSWASDWAELEKQLKNNDLEVSYGQVTEIRTIHAWVKEYNGKLSHYIAPYCKDKKADFLFKKLDRFENNSQAFTIFTSDTGNGEYHSIRGLHWKLFPMMQALNRARCTTLDNAVLSSSMWLQPKDGASMNEPPLVMNGPVAFISPEMEVQAVTLPNISQQMIPVINDLANLVQNNTGSYRPRATDAGNKEQTKFEVQTQVEMESSLNVSQVNTFYRSWRRSVQEIFRRVQAIGPNNKRFPEVQEFYQCCADRGVDAEIIKRVKRVEPIRAIGLGSPTKRLQIANQNYAMIGGYDEKGKIDCIRDLLVQINGSRDVADRYRPKAEKSRPVIDESIAELENNDARLGQEIDEPKPGQLHAVHATVHVSEMLESIKLIEEIQMQADQTGGEIDFDTIEKEMQFLQIMIPHTKPHIDQMSMDDTREAESAAYRQAFQQINGIFQNTLKQLVRHIQNQQAEAAANAGEQGVDPEQAAMWQQHILELRKMDNEHRAKMQHTAEEVQQKLALQRIEFDEKQAQRIREGALKIKIAKDAAKAKPAAKKPAAKK